jgi:dTDP-4-dehydrorhamnose 3,5-epimerase
VIFRETPLDGLFVVEPDQSADDRGYFARTWCREAFADKGLDTDLAQCSTSFNRRRGTLRGLHFQAPPHEETKLVRCTRGRIFDVALDMRAGSATHGKWWAAELTADNGHMMFIPAGFAHGFQTLEDASEVFYQISAAYVPGAARGVRWDDPALAIEWPLPDPILSDRDARNPPFPAPACVVG